MTDSPAMELEQMGITANAGIVLRAAQPTARATRAGWAESPIVACAIARDLPRHYRLSPP